MAIVKHIKSRNANLRKLEKRFWMNLEEASFEKNFI